MNKYYRMIVENPKTGERDTWVGKRQGETPRGWINKGVRGYMEMPPCEDFDFAWQARRFADKTAI